jgi:predicted nucleotidyltransferase
MFTKNNIVKTIHNNTDEIRTYGVRRIGVFGSFVKAAQNNKSDIDILVEFNKGDFYYIESKVNSD